MLFVEKLKLNLGLDFCKNFMLNEVIRYIIDFEWKYRILFIDIL